MTVLPGQTTMFEEAIPGSIFTQEPLMVTITAKLKRKPRQKCDNCGKRRIGFCIDLSGYTASQVLCARCAGLR